MPRKWTKQRRCWPIVDSWPLEDKPDNFEQLAEAVRDAIEQAYSLKRKAKRTIKWTGPPVVQPPPMYAQVPGFDDQLSAKSLEFNEEDQGRNTLDVIIGIALSLGIEQGRRIERGYQKDLREHEEFWKKYKR